MLKATETRKKTTWSTWEELLLAFAVKRHGLRDWDSVAMELQNRCSIPAVITAQICKDKYHDLHRRFMNNDAADGEVEDGRGIAIPWLEELRQLRVAELKQEVQRYDLSIQSLQLKVKRLEEREQSLRESKDVSVEPDLEDDGKEQRSENDENGGGRETSEDVAGKDVSCKDSDRENRSFNESNSTENRGTGEKVGPDSVEAGPTKPDPEAKPVWEEDSCNDSTDRHKASKQRNERKTDGESAAELRDSVSESKEGTKESSDVQSSASLTERRRKRVDVGGRTVTAAASPAISTKRGSAVKPEALVELLDIIRSHKHGQVFERRLDTQKTDDYKKAIRRHVDLETVQARIDDGSYSSCSTRFYLDLLLLFNNAIVFFPKSSPESTAAYQLRDLAMKELKKNQTPSTDPSPEPSSTKAQPKLELERSDSLLAKHKSTAPIVVCRKRSSISAKTATSGNKQGKLSDEKPPLSQKLAVKSSSSTPDEDDSSTKLKMKEKPVTGVRSTRRSSKGNPNPSQSTANNNQSRTVKQTGTGGGNKGEAAKADKKEEVITTDKKRGAADFLKRMKKDSQGTMVVSVKNSSEDGKASSRREQQKKKQPTEERKDGPVRRSGGGGSGRKEAEESSLSRRNVGRPPKRGRDAAPEKRGKESSEKEDSSKRPKKRSRR